MLGSGLAEERVSEQFFDGAVDVPVVRALILCAVVIVIGPVGRVGNLAHAVSLHFIDCNVGRVHQTLKETPATAAGIADHVWSPEEIAGLLDSN
jgi:hypothetical protein